MVLALQPGCPTGLPCAGQPCNTGLPEHSLPVVSAGTAGLTDARPRHHLHLPLPLRLLRRRRPGGCGVLWSPRPRGPPHLHRRGRVPRACFLIVCNACLARLGRCRVRDDCPSGRPYEFLTGSVTRKSPNRSPYVPTIRAATPASARTISVFVLGSYSDVGPCALPR